MAQSDYELAAHISGLNQRTEINSIFDSILTHNSGSTAPTVTKAFMMWVDTSNATYYYLKMRNHDNTAWVTLFIYTVATKVITPFIINSPTTNAIPKINSDGTIGNSNIINDASGNTGFGVTPSISTDVGNITLGGGKTINYTTEQGQIVSNATYNSGWKYLTAARATKLDFNNGVYTFNNAVTGAIGNVITWTNAMVLDASGLQINKSYTNSPPLVTAQYDASNYVYFQGRNTVDTTEIFLSLVGGSKRSAILANGSFQSATNSYGGTSDAKLKENVVETSDKLNKLMNVRVVNFNYIGDDQKQIGVIAQEVEKIFPGIVYETKDTKQVEVEKEREKTLEDGTVEIEKYTETETVETGEVTKNVKYSVIYMMMLKGMQEQQAIINDLKARIEILESK